jgi:hypothetical protein
MEVRDESKKDKDGCAVTALAPTVNGEVCRAVLKNYENNKNTLALLKILPMGRRQIQAGPGSVRQDGSFVTPVKNIKTSSSIEFKFAPG